MGRIGGPRGIGGRGANSAAGLFRRRLLGGPESAPFRDRIIYPGIGIAERDVPQIFDGFNRADRSPGEVEGRGAGLAIARSIAKMVIRRSAGKNTSEPLW